MQESDLFVVDPSMKEEAAAAGTLTVVMNSHNEVCLVSKSGGLGLSVSQVSRFPPTSLPGSVSWSSCCNTLHVCRLELKEFLSTLSSVKCLVE